MWGEWHSRWPPWSTNVFMVAPPSTSPMTASLFRRLLVVGFCVRRLIWNWLYRGQEQWLLVRVLFLCVDQRSGTCYRAHWDRQNFLITVFGRNLKLNCSWKAANVICAPLRCSSINCAPTYKFTNKLINSNLNKLIQICVMTELAKPAKSLFSKCDLDLTFIYEVIQSGSSNISMRLYARFIWL